MCFYNFEKYLRINLFVKYKFISLNEIIFCFVFMMSFESKVVIKTKTIIIIINILTYRQINQPRWLEWQREALETNRWDTNRQRAWWEVESIRVWSLDLGSSFWGLVWASRAIRKFHFANTCHKSCPKTNNFKVIISREKHSSGCFTFSS